MATLSVVGLTMIDILFILAEITPEEILRKEGE